MTYLEVINAVLRRLREDTVTASSNNDYSKLIGDLVNQAMHECEHAWDWQALKNGFRVLTEAGTRAYDLPSPDAKIIQAVNVSKSWRLHKMSASEEYELEYFSPISGSPTHYQVRARNAGNTAQLFVLRPTPDAEEHIEFHLVEYTQAYDVDGTDDTEILRIPTMPIILRAYALAISERGEDGGATYNEADQRADSSLMDEIGTDTANSTLSETSWYGV